MVIKKAEDIFDLLDERIEAMEDLNCEELKECVKIFMLAHTTITTMESAKELAANEDAHSQIAVNGKQTFNNGLRLAKKMLKRIDELTLIDDAAE